jgi:hypothetical protein
MQKWSGWLLVLVIVVAITTGGIISQRYLDRSADELSFQLERVQQAVAQKDWTGSEGGVALLEQHWSGVHDNWALFTDHLELDDLELSLIRLQKFIEARDEVNAMVEVSEAMDMIRCIPERERLTWRNIF